ncbi:AMP-binding protein [bacterium]|nr:AMP-binding protein [bacterium]
MAVGKWKGRFQQWRAYQLVMKRLKVMLKSEPEVAQAATSKKDFRWIGQGKSSVELLARACQRFADRPCLATRQPDAEYVPISYAQLWRRVVALAGGLREHGVEAGSLVGLCGFCSLDWAVADLACLYLGAISVPMASTISQSDFVHALNETELTCLIIDAEQLSRLKTSLAQCPSVQTVVAMHKDLGAGQLCLEQLLESRAKAIREVPPAEALFSIVYTSGSTGAPKGVMLSHGRWLQTLRDALTRPAVPRLAVGYLPLSHMAGRIKLYTSILGGGTLSLVASPDMSTLWQDIQLARPTHLLLVPRVSGMIYQHFQSEMLKRGRLADLATMLADPQGKSLAAEMRADFLGGRLCFVHTGAAPTPLEVSAFLRRGLGLHVTDLYGSTEMGPVMLNGRVHDWIDYKLVDRPELGYTYPRGELAVKSPRASQGYYKNEPASQAVQDEQGYFLTGDMVEERAPRQLMCLDRRQNVARLAHGEFVDLSRLEDLFQAYSPLIDQAFLYANPYRSYLLAVLVPHRSALQASCDPRPLLRDELQRVARQANLASHEVPRDFYLEERPFSQENGLLSAANKTRRPQLKETYGPRLEELYASLEERQVSLVEVPGLPVSERVRAALGLDLPERGSYGVAE